MPKEIMNKMDDLSTKRFNRLFIILGLIIGIGVFIISQIDQHKIDLKYLIFIPAGVIGLYLIGFIIWSFYCMCKGIVWLFENTLERYVKDLDKNYLSKKEIFIIYVKIIISLCVLFIIMAIVSTGNWLKILS